MESPSENRASLLTEVGIGQADSQPAEPGTEKFGLRGEPLGELRFTSGLGNVLSGDVCCWASTRAGETTKLCS